MVKYYPQTLNGTFAALAESNPAANSGNIVYHFMFGPGWKRAAKAVGPGRSTSTGANWHLPHRDASLVVILRAVLWDPNRKKRMGWRFKWAVIDDSDLNFDYHVSSGEEKAK